MAVEYQYQYSPVEVLRHLWWIGVLSLLVSLVTTPIVRLIAYRKKIVDRPDDLLKPHTRPTAYLGGVAMCVGLLAGLAAYVAVTPDMANHWARLKSSLAGGNLTELWSNPLWNLLAVAVASVVIMVVGLVDDVRGLRPRNKVYGQVVAAMILLAGGIGDRMARIIEIGFNMPVWLLVPISTVLLLVCVIAACNATNLLDGLDGLCGGVTGIICLGFLALTVWLAMFGRFPGMDQLRVALCLAMAGGVLGFLPYNIPPASIFMGDAGSMLLGFFVATMMAMFCQEGTARWFVAACAIFSLPILDTALAVVRRVLSGENIFAGDRSHLYDQLVDRGMTVKQVVVLFYCLAGLAAGIGVVVSIYLRGRHAVILYAILLAVIWSIFYKFGMIAPEARKTSEPQKGEASAEED